MHSPKGNREAKSPRANGNLSPNAEARNMSPRSRKLHGFKPKTLSEMRSISPGSKRSNSPFSKHERSFSTLYSKFMEHKIYSDTHELGYTADQIKQAVNYIFQKYDKNHDGLLDRAEGSLRQMGNNHVPNELEIVEFIYSMDKNNDGKLSRNELEGAFKRANKIQY